MPRRELLLLGEMIDAAEQATRLVADWKSSRSRMTVSAATLCCGTSLCSARRRRSSRSQ